MAGKRTEVSFEFQPKQRTKRRHRDEDRISQLPNDILIDILSRLSLKEAARTSVLSSRWVNLWKHTSRLVFDAASSLLKTWNGNKILDAKRSKYINWVNRVLRLHQSLNLKEFIIRFNLNRSSQRAINHWLKHASSRQVKKLELDLVEHFYDVHAIYPLKFANIKSLKELSLKSVNVTGEVIVSFLHNCPVLEHLVVHNSNKLIDHLEICGPTLALKYLEVRDCNKLKSMKVWNSNIVTLIVDRLEALILENVPSLIEVCTGIVPNFKVLDKVFDWLSCCISQLEILHLRTFSLESNMEGCKFPELPKLKKLVFKLWIENDKSMLDVTYLMRVCPHLQEFVLELGWRRPSREIRAIKSIKFLHQHLKVVKFLGYYGRTSDVELLKYLLDNCASLKKVIIDPRDQVRSESPLDALVYTPGYHAQTEGIARNLAKQQLQGAAVPPHIQIVLL